MTALSSSSPGILAATKAKLLLVLSLAVTWYIAGLVPHYTPQLQASFKSRLEEARQKIPSIQVNWHPTPGNDDPRTNFNGTKIALLVEPRPIPHLVPQILHMINVVPPDWRFVFIGSNQSVVSVGRAYATKHQQFIGKLDLMVLPEPWEINDKEKVYRTLTDIRFYDEFLPGVEWILKYEHDSIIHENDRFSGNGGLSLRKVSAIRRILAFQQRLNDTQPEDEWFGGRVWTLPGANVAQGEKGQLAVEDVYIKNPIGFHVRDGGANMADGVWKSYAQRKEIFEYCPELSVIMDMKLETERCFGDNKEGSISGSNA